MRVPSTPKINPINYIVTGIDLYIIASKMTIRIICVLKSAVVGPFGALSMLSALMPRIAPPNVTKPVMKP